MAEEDLLAALADRHQREQARRERINGFRERQRVARRWIEFVEIAKWCARSTTGASADDEQRALELAYRRLADSMLQGEFEADGRSKILYLAPRVLSIGTYPHRLTRDWFKRESEAAAEFGERFRITSTAATSSPPMNVLVHCWLPRDLARRWLEAHGYPWSPHFEPVLQKSEARNIDQFDLQPGWIPVTAALEIIKAAVGDLAWEQLKRAIRFKSLPARCRADGVNRDLESHWLDFLAFDDPEGDCLSFDRLKAAEAKFDVPDLATDVVVSIARCAELWPDAAWENPSVVDAADDDVRSEREFRSPDWSLGNVLSWIAFRDPALICRFEGRHDLLTYRRYDYPRSRNPKRPILDPRADQTLLDVLKDGGLTAIRNGAEIPGTHWFGKYPSHISDDLRFRRAQVIGCWPLDSSEVAAIPGTTKPTAPPPPIVGTGMPGRPSKGKHLIDDEFDRRVANGVALPSLAEEATALFDWFKQRHPTLARPTTKTIKENIRARHRQWKACHPKADTN